MKWSQFSLAQMFAAMTWFALASLMEYVTQQDPPYRYLYGTSMWILLATGIGALFRRTLLGFLIGLGLMLALWIFAFPAVL
jgi:hypothetical protein